VDDLRLGVVGAGVMGSGIAQTLAQSGYDTVCCDVVEEVLQKARSEVVSGRYGLDRAVERGKITRGDADAALARLHFSSSLEDVASRDLVIECVPESLDLKIKVRSS
jgi:3-hydroxybutyryl-CoA dehydrogenase